MIAEHSRHVVNLVEQFRLTTIALSLPLAFADLSILILIQRFF